MVSGRAPCAQMGGRMLAQNMENVKAGRKPSPGIPKWIPFVAGEIAVVLFVYLLVRLQDWGLDPMWFRSPVSVGILYGTMLVMLLVTGLLPDFLHAFLYSFQQPEKIEKVPLRRALLSVKLALGTVLVAGLADFAYSFVSMAVSFSYMSPQESAGGAAQMLSMAFLAGSLVHGIFPVLLLLPVYARLKIKLL